MNNDGCNNSTGEQWLTTITQRFSSVVLKKKIVQFQEVCLHISKPVLKFVYWLEFKTILQNVIKPDTEAHNRKCISGCDYPDPDPDYSYYEKFLSVFYS